MAFLSLRSFLPLALSTILAGLASCGGPSIEEGAIACSLEGRCPPGFDCGADGRCYHGEGPTSDASATDGSSSPDGTVADAGTATADAALVDATSADAPPIDAAPASPDAVVHPNPIGDAGCTGPEDPQCSGPSDSGTSM